MRLPALTITCVLLSSLAWSGQPTASTTVAVPNQPNLTAADFSVSVNGKTTVPSFVVPLPAPAKIPTPDTLTSVPAEKISGPTILVLDVMETRATDERDMRKSILRYLTEAAARNESVGLLVLKPDRLKVVHDYRVGSQVLAAAMSVVNGKGPVAVPGAERVLAEETSRLLAFAKGEDANPAPLGQLLQVNLETPIFMMQDVGAALRDLPGRKALVWITAGVPFEILDNDHSVTSHQENNLGAAVNGARVGSLKRILSDDQIRKLQPTWRAAMRALFESGTGVYPVEVHGSTGIRRDILFTSAMDTLAKMTGGRASYGSNDPGPFFDSIAAENSNAYSFVVSYDPAKADWQKLAITTTKSPKVIAAEGFFPATPSSAEDVRNNEIKEALASPLSYAALPFNFSLGDQVANGAKKTVKFSVFLSPDAGIADPKANEVNLDLAVLALAPNGTHAGFMSTAAGGKLPPEAIKQIAANGVNLAKSIDLPPGEYTLRVVVRDNLSGRIGTVNADVKVQ